MQYMSALRKARGRAQSVNTSRRAAELLQDFIATHLENAAVGACASYMRALLARRPRMSGMVLARETRSFVEATGGNTPFETIFSLLLRRKVSPVEARILQTLGTIQIHHGSAGSNMVARYFASLHTRSISDLLTAAQMALDCARHFGAITDLGFGR
jgi:hypothetical protein